MSESRILPGFSVSSFERDGRRIWQATVWFQHGCDITQFATEDAARRWAESRLAAVRRG